MEKAITLWIIGFFNLLLSWTSTDWGSIMWDAAEAQQHKKMLSSSKRRCNGLTGSGRLPLQRELEMTDEGISHKRPWKWRPRCVCVMQKTQENFKSLLCNRFPVQSWSHHLAFLCHSSPLEIVPHCLVQYYESKSTRSCKAYRRYYSVRNCARAKDAMYNFIYNIFC